MCLQNQAASSHRYKTLQEFVRQQMHYLALERHEQEQSVLEREQADRALREPPAHTYFDSRPSSSSGNLPAVPQQYTDGRGRNNSKKIRTSQLLPNGMLVETIDVAKDETEARARAKASARGRFLSSYSPSSQKRDTTPSVRNVNAASNPVSGDLNSLIEPSTVPWLQAQPRRFSSPMLVNKIRKISSDNLGITHSRHFGGSTSDLRMSTQSMTLSRPESPAAFRSPSLSRQSFATVGASPRESSVWRRNFRNRSPSASVLSLAPSGSMMEMHLAISQDKHSQNPSYRELRNMHAPGATWSDPASAVDEIGGISPDEDPAAATSARKKKGFKGFFNSLRGAPPSLQPRHPSKNRRAATDSTASWARMPPDKRESSLNYAAADNEDYSEPLAPPPPFSLLTGQQPNRRSYSLSSQSSASPVLHPSEYNVVNNIRNRPDSLGVPVAASSSGFISPSTSWSDFNRMRPSSVTSWRSSSQAGSVQSPRETIAEVFGTTTSATRKSSGDDGAPGFRLVPSLEPSQDSVDLTKLRREKSLPALPTSDSGEEVLLDETSHPVHGLYTHQAQHTWPPSHPTRPAAHLLAQGQPILYTSDSLIHYQMAVQGQDPSWPYKKEDCDGPEIHNVFNGKPEKIKKEKSRSKLFGFGGKKARSSTSPPTRHDYAVTAPRTDPYIVDSFVPHEKALQAVSRDNPAELVSYR